MNNMGTIISFFKKYFFKKFRFVFIIDLYSRCYFLSQNKKFSVKNYLEQFEI
jgi:hypothetical protein